MTLKGTECCAGDTPGQREFDSGGRRLSISALLNFGIALAQIAGGFFSGSLALMSDAVHNLSDSFSLALGYAAWKIGKRNSTKKRTYGYKRIEILAALLNTSILVVICFFLIKSAIERFLNPQPIDTGIMLAVAAVGLAANLFSVLLLHSHAHHSLNIRAAYLCLVADTVSSVAVIGGGLLIHYYGILAIDPLLTIAIALWALRGSFRILFRTLDILMQSAPGHIDLNEIKARAERLPGVNNIHHIHLWQINEHLTCLEAHIDVDHHYTVSDTNGIRESVERLLQKDFGIGHTVLQIEHNACAERSLVHGSQHE